MKEMINDEDFKLLKIQTCVLRVNIHCDGCKQKVKKLLQRIEGVYQVNIDVEQQKVTVSGGIDAATLIKKLVKAGKHAELWSQKGSQNNNQKQQKGNCIKDDKNNSKCQKQQGLIKGLKKQQNFQFNLQDDENFLDDDEEEECDGEAEMRLVIEKANQISLLRQQAAAIEGNKKNFAAMAAAQNNANSGKKGNQQSGIDQKTMAALKMNNNVGGETKMGGNDINAMMNNLVGFNGNGANNNLAAMLGGNHQVQATNNNGFIGGFPTTMASTGNHPHNHPSSMMANMNHQQYPSSMLMNLQQQQPQMMYNRSPFVPSSTGYYYNYAPAPYPDNTYTTADHSDVFRDYNTNSCSIM